MNKKLLPAIVLCATTCAGCASLPKVEAWQKGNLAKPSMALDADSLEGMLGQHTYQSKEAASGGYGVGGTSIDCHVLLSGCAKSACV